MYIVEGCQYGKLTEAERNKNFAENRPTNVGFNQPDQDVRPEFCSANRCEVKLGPHNSYKCKVCLQYFCLKHRYEDSHNCVANQAEGGEKDKPEKLDDSVDNEASDPTAQSDPVSNAPA